MVITQHDALFNVDGVASLLFKNNSFLSTNKPKNTICSLHILSSLIEAIVCSCFERGPPVLVSDQWLQTQEIIILRRDESGGTAAQTARGSSLF